MPTADVSILKHFPLSSGASWGGTLSPRPPILLRVLARQDESLRLSMVSIAFSLHVQCIFTKTFETNFYRKENEASESII